MIADLVRPEKYDETAARVRHIYDLMKNEHPFLTSGEDSVFAAMLALSPMTDAEIVSETERCFELLKGEFFSSSAVQSLSHVLALGEGTPEEKCRKTMELFHGLKKKGCRYGTGYELATLGALALLPKEADSTVGELIEADHFLEKQKRLWCFRSGEKAETDACGNAADQRLSGNGQQPGDEFRRSQRCGFLSGSTADCGLCSGRCCRHRCPRRRLRVGSLCRI